MTRSSTRLVYRVRPQRVGLIPVLDVMRNIVATVFLLLLSAPAAATSDGELAWTKVDFCNGAGYCVKIETNPDNELGAIAITHNGVEIDVPDLGVVKGEPDLRLVRLVTLAEANGYANRLEIPFFGAHASRLEIHIKDDVVDAFKFVDTPADDV
jgi:hypothetical protein